MTRSLSSTSTITYRVLEVLLPAWIRTSTAKVVGETAAAVCKHRDCTQVQSYRLTLVVWVVLLVVSSVAQSARSQICGIWSDVGPAAGTYTYAEATGVSDDGSVVCGYYVYIHTSGMMIDRAFRWTPVGGFETIGPDFSRAHVISGNGAVIYCTDQLGWYRRQDLSGTTRLSVSGGNIGTIAGVSFLGSEVVGTYSLTSAPGLRRAFRWQPGLTGGGTLQDLGTNGGTESEAYGISADGSVVVGFYAIGSGAGMRMRAFRHTATGGMQSLGAPFGDGHYTASSVSSDGLVVAGITGGGAGEGVFRWTASTGMQRILDGDAFWPVRVSADGSRMVFGGGMNANIWSAAGGFESISIPGADYLAVNAASADCAHVVGRLNFGPVSPAFLWSQGQVPTLTDAPENVSVCPGATAVFQVSAFGTTPLEYVWRHDGVNINATTNPSAATASLSLHDVQASDEGMYDCVITNACGTLTTLGASLTLGEVPGGNIEFDDIPRCEDGTLTLMVTPSGTGPFQYQWHKNTSALHDNARITGATSPTLVISPLVPDDADVYFCSVSNGSCETAVEGPLVIVRALPVISTQPEDRTVCVGESSVFQVATAGFVTPLYQWFHNSNPVSLAANPSANSPTFTIPITSLGDDGVYRCVVTNTCGFVTSSDALLGVSLCGSSCDSIDFNHDSLFPDTQDLDDYLSVFSGGPCSNDPNCGDIDFNNDQLFPDTADIDSILRVFSGGTCL